MITCLGLIVGVVTSDKRGEILNQCARFLDKYRHLLDLAEVNFEIDGKVYATLYDYHYFGADELGRTFGVLFKMYDGFVDAAFI